MLGKQNFLALSGLPVGNIFKTSKLDKNSVCSILEQVAADGKINNLLSELRRKGKIDNEGSFKKSKWVLINL